MDYFLLLEYIIRLAKAHVTNYASMSHYIQVL